MKENYKQKGFTVIELLVVVAIIGVLSTMVIIHTGSANAKARDVDRINDLKTMSKLLTEIDIDTPGDYFATPCDTADTSTTACVGVAQPADIEIQFLKYKDPAFSSIADANANPCLGGDVAPCQYSIMSDNSTVDDAVIRFYLEKSVGDLLAGPHTMTSAGAFN